MNYNPRKIWRLKQEALGACRWRRHSMGRWSDSTKGKTSLCTCKKCGKWVQVDVSPPPNGIDIGGPAVALGCGDRESNPRRSRNPITAAYQRGRTDAFAGKPFYGYQNRKLHAEYTHGYQDALQELRGMRAGIKQLVGPRRYKKASEAVLRWAKSRRSNPRRRHRLARYVATRRRRHSRRRS